jgi:glycosyltransferase involved in cell wall biosynthesis
MHVGLVCSADFDYGLDLANALNEVGVSVTLYLSHARTAKAVGASDRLEERLYERGILSVACRVRLLRFPRVRDPRSLAVVHRLHQTMRDEGVDVVHILMGPGELWLAVLACLVRGIPVASTMIWPQPLGEDQPDFVIAAINKLLARGSNVVIVNGADQVALVQKLYGLPTSRTAYVPLGARTTAVKWSCRRNTEEPGTVLFFGRADPRKGLEYLVQAQPIITRQVPHARIMIAAHGENLEHCRQMIQDSSKFEIHEGFAPGDVAAAFFERASLVALPYVKASTSGILMTAYVFGKPVVATSVGSLLEYVEDGVTGLLVPPCNVEQLAEAIVRLLSDDVLRHRMGENAKRWVDEEQKRIALQTVRVYERAISVHSNDREV